jgi:hypothetical protein
MPKICYIDKKFNPEHLKLIGTVNGIISDYRAQGYDLTLRQVYYQLVAHDLFPDDRKFTWTGSKWVRDPDGTKNADPNYKWLGGIIDDGRLAGLIDWQAIIDRTRNLKALSHWDEPSDIIQSAAESFRIDKWKDQESRVEVWVEKDALVGVVGQVCDRWDVPYFSCRGYTSSSEMWVASQRLARYKRQNQVPTIIHLGDHDPSGKDMTRDIDDRLALFMGGLEVNRIALNMDQIEQYDPPPNPAKITDSRAKRYIEEFGDESWELDALEPSVIDALIDEQIQQIIDIDLWEEVCEAEEKERQHLGLAASRWAEVVTMLDKPKPASPQRKPKK